MIVFWFRRDLRLDDNTGLHNAIASGEKVLPIFIFDRNILDELPKDDHRVTFIAQLLDGINADLKKAKNSLAIFHDEPEEVFNKLIAENEITAVYTNHDYEPYAKTRDKAISDILLAKGIEFKTFKDQVIFEKDEVVKSDGTPYVVYTPYSNQWKALLKKQSFKIHNTKISQDNFATHSYPYLNLKDIGFKESELKIFPYDVSSEIIDNYEDRRNFPVIQGTSRVSPYLRFGAISIRKLVKKATESSNGIYLNELIWREFFMQILWHYPQTVTKAFRPKYDSVQWRNSEQDFKAWCEGKTGFPMVDAGMRQMNTMGYMHNRVRLVVASFFCKHLLLDWRKGEAYFAEKLFDYEQSSNIGNWQWAAGSGVDAAPYFRVFNPTEQAKKFDKDLKYIRQWVPEFEDLNYKPIVDHKEARERALRVYKEGLNS
jgi:deoxyribodipyrimidine photo-lyase